MQRRETLGAKEFQTAQIKDQPAATHHVRERVLGQGVCVRPVDVAVGADNGHRRHRPASVQSRFVTLHRRAENGIIRQRGWERVSHGDPSVQTITGVWGLGASAPWVQQRAAELIPDQLRFSAPMTLHRLEGSARCEVRQVAESGTGQPTSPLRWGHLVAGAPRARGWWPVCISGPAPGRIMSAGFGDGGFHRRP